MAFLKNILFNQKPIKFIEMVYGIDNELEEGEVFIQADATISESYALSSSVTNFPVEGGSNLAEHSSKDAFRITVSGIISDASMSYADTFDSLLGSPIGDLTQRFVGSNLKTKTQRSYDILQRWMVTATPVIVKCHYAKDGIKSSLTGDNAPFIIESLTVPRDKSTGQSLRFEMNLREILIVTINKSIPVPGVKIKIDKGAKSLMSNAKSQTADAKNESQNRTLAKLKSNGEARNYLHDISGGVLPQ